MPAGKTFYIFNTDEERNLTSRIYRKLLLKTRDARVKIPIIRQVPPMGEWVGEKIPAWVLQGEKHGKGEETERENVVEHEKRGKIPLSIVEFKKIKYTQIGRKSRQKVK